MSVLVVGAGGFLGLNVVDALLHQGIMPVCARRRRSNVIPLRSRKVPMRLLDLDEADSVVEAMEGVDVVVHAAGHYPRFSNDRAATLAIGLRQLKVALDAASSAGVRRFIYLSSTATVAPAGGGLSDESHQFADAPGFGVYHDLKWHMEALALAETRMEVVVACPGACLGPWDLRIGTSALLVAVARGMCPPHPSGVVNIVDARDVGAAVANLAQHARPPRRLILAHENHDLHELLGRLALRYGAPPPSVPLAPEVAMSFADAQEERARTQGGRAALSREIVDLIVRGVPVTAGLAERSLGLRWRPLNETLDASDNWARRMRFIPPESIPEEVHP